MWCGTRLRAAVANVSKKAFRYHFQTATATQLRTMRGFDDGTDRVLLTPNLIAVADCGTGEIGDISQDHEPGFTERFLKVLNYFYYQEPERYSADLVSLVGSAAEHTKEDGSCSISVAAIDRNTGQVGLYHLGDALNAIFREKDIVMVEAHYETAFRPFQIGSFVGSSVERGQIEYYSRKDMKGHTLALASNGLWNNVGLDELHNHIKGPASLQKRKTVSSEAVGADEEPEPKSLQQIANQVCGMGAYYGRMAKYQSPFWKRIQGLGGDVPKEGYLDDVTVVLARVARTVQID